MIQRIRRRRDVVRLLRHNPVVAILGARQVGKTTLARQVGGSFRGRVHWFDLEQEEDLARLEHPRLTLEPLRGLVVIDEVQRRPDLFRALRVLVDQAGVARRFLILGSASSSLLRQSSESLSGRIAYYNLTGFSLEEVGGRNFERLWMRGGFPRSFLAPTEHVGSQWRRDLIRTFVERDLPLLGITIPPVTLQRFWRMLAHYHGQVWNASEFARSFGVADMTVRRYLDILSSTFVVRQLFPWHENIGKRQVKAPKIYVADTGLLHTLLGIEGFENLQGHPKLGASWEGFALETTIQALGVRPDECFFWATHAGAELDLLVVRGRHRRGFEFKHTDAPRLTPSMRIAQTDLNVDSIEVIHAGRKNFPLSDRIRAVALRNLMG